MRPDLARLVMALVKPVRLVWPRLDEGLNRLMYELVTGPPARKRSFLLSEPPALKLRSVVQAVAEDHLRRRAARKPSSDMRPELARVLFVLLRPVMWVWPRLRRDFTEAYLHFLLNGTEEQWIATMPMPSPALPLLAVARAVAADDNRRYQAQRGAQR